MTSASRFLRRYPTVAVGGLLMLLLVLIAIFAPWLGTVDPTAGSALILPAYAAVFLGATAIKPGRINALGALVAVYFLATGTAGLELLGAQSYIQQIFYGAALVVAITIPKVNRDRIFKRRRTA